MYLVTEIAVLLACCALFVGEMNRGMMNPLSRFERLITRMLGMMSVGPLISALVLMMQEVKPTVNVALSGALFALFCQTSVLLIRIGLERGERRTDKVVERINRSLASGQE